MADGKLDLRVWSMFTIAGDVDHNGKLKVHWDGNKNKPGEPTAANTIKGATLGVVGQRTPPSSTDLTGRALLDLRQLRDGPYTLRLSPPAGLEANAPAGVYLDPPKDASRLYRSLDIRFQWTNGRIASSPPPAIEAAGSQPIHGAIVEWDSNALTIDWKPDWVRAKNIKARGWSVARAEKKKKGANKAEPKPEDFAPKCIVLHRTTKPSIGSSLNEFLTHDENAHYLIDRDGFVVKLVHERDEASHAGAGAQWRGIQPLNAHSIGIELVNASGPMTDAQMKSLSELLKALMGMYGIPKVNVVGHCEVSPIVKKNGLVVNNRIDCPGREFDWQRLERERLTSTLYTPRGVEKDTLLGPHPYFTTFDVPLMNRDTDAKRIYGGKPRPPEFHDTVKHMQLLLRDLGYESPVAESTPQDEAMVLPIWGKFDEAMGRLVQRFKMRYLAQRDDEEKKPPIDTNLDKVTAYTIRRAYYGRGLP